MALRSGVAWTASLGPAFVVASENGKTIPTGNKPNEKLRGPMLSVGLSHVAARDDRPAVVFPV